jgi:hypothetical protein
MHTGLKSQSAILLLPVVLVCTPALAQDNYARGKPRQCA